MAISDRIDIKKALVLAAAPLAALALVGVVSAGGSTTTAAPSATPNPSATSASPTPTPTTPSTPSPSTPTTTYYTESDLDDFLTVVATLCPTVNEAPSEDITSLVDSIIAAHARGVTFTDVIKVATENFPEDEAQLLVEQVVVYLMKNLPEDDSWKVATEAAQQARAEAQEAEKAEAEKAEAEKAEAEKAEAEKAEAEKAEPEMTTAQEQAVGKAQDYLEYTHFSKSGLIKQLKYEGFSKKVATFAVEYLDVNWKKQAAGKASDYLDYTHFSRSGLIAQLEYEGFTESQAEYGVEKAGL